MAVAGVAALLVPQRREHVAGHAYALPSPGRRIRVEVLNGTRRPGFARVATRALRQQGLDVVFFGTGPLADSTRIYVRRGDPGQGRDVAEALGIGRVVVQPDTLRRVDVSVLIGSDWKLRLPLRP